ncbi:bi-domain-containing oxidoreductase [Laribacter hongkongensis]|uniref:bi-domain-containing oxidoreductase n=1 Tax=Laribacter hongkongensis TaxID=168471 RepID=UPI001EFEBB9C|nr:bi-domain-containing oxidoreductase [Laribacter hongkongensis]MCG8992289.1 bi-domain-containing oxidoreductase [Laribacter hongkongensis]MCG8999048.1 bi-domain-containing oxidoreductase [Laribacter hongkongensis]MCG9001737.1 bi-domain-containing oxidoreductase [Laribacter hongkongensis]MCG9004985.1 bi-domain-containing oxidoreductase [Laribacter hongkongensis]MCG9007205.1 bi-domain-containing oxidoreductase [Laribacter hongkongensis]
MKQVLIKAGAAVVEEVPAPLVGRKNILVRVTHSCISVGTEMAGVKMSGLPLYQRALKQPENVKRVLEMMRDQGVKRTMDRVMGKLSAGSATGYSAAGVVIELGDEVEGFAVGDRVACAGAGIANHAEVIDVPVNLAVKIPEYLETSIASTVTLGAIAMQGVRRAQPTLGETFVVVGLGILGQITAQMLSANGCRVIGVDIDPKRIQLALDNGMDIGINPALENYVERVLKFTDGLGADAVIVTAATESNQVISEAMQVCRKKGRVVLVGDVGLDLNRADFYKKELDFLISTSYGPGRYDPFYEDGGQDYPIAYVRWTENRNMQAYIDLLAKGKVRLGNLYHSPYSIDKAGEAYDALKGCGDKPLLVVLEYPERDGLRITRVPLRTVKVKPGKIRVALAGASSFAQGMHLPNMVKLRDRFTLQAVMSRTGANARAVATQYEAAYCTTEYDDILKDDEIDLVMVATRHDLHGPMVLQALHAGKHVFVEKPLALHKEDIAEIERFYAEHPAGPLLMVGFNRRFSPAMQTIRDILANRTTPIIVNYRMNAGYIPLNHWVHGPEGGGRNIGEACHIYDLFNSLVGTAQIEVVNAYSIIPSSKQWMRNDNFVATLKYADGSICTLTYTALGDKSYPKERMEVFADGKVLTMDDYKSVTVHGGKHKGWSSAVMQKGQLEELEALSATLLKGSAWPISLEEQLRASYISLEVENQITGRE